MKQRYPNPSRIQIIISLSSLIIKPWNGSKNSLSMSPPGCRCRQEEITINVLEYLTSPELMPIIAEEESLYYLQLLVSLGVENDPSLFDRCRASTEVV